jgi:hypothetical protein
VLSCALANVITLVSKTVDDKMAANTPNVNFLFVKL